MRVCPKQQTRTFSKQQTTTCPEQQTRTCSTPRSPAGSQGPSDSGTHYKPSQGKGPEMIPENPGKTELGPCEVARPAKKTC
ncbi:hypothetical protein T484DRAFT_2508236 [Baffinella frigidus]|nr:hypothetical protein T484DRAFT_2508236 [Cryptophyta sp. CCMP2293]